MASSLSRPAVLGAAVDFGLGPSGKLASIIESHQQFRWFVAGDPLSSEMVEGLPIARVLWSRDPKALSRFVQQHQIVAAVVVLDPLLANLFENIGVPVVYVDSLPFLWTDRDLLPHRVSSYCAQFTPFLPQPCWKPLRAIENLQWVEAIVPKNGPTWKPIEGNIIVNFGGVHSTRSRRYAYLETILPPLLAVLDQSWCRRVIFTGSAGAITFIKQRLASLELPKNIGIDCEALSHRRFLQSVAESALLLTSPGLTTLLETATLGIPTVLLPPQNLSQYRNAAVFLKLVSCSRAISWANPTLHTQELDKLCPRGEEHVVDHIWHQIELLIGAEAEFTHLKESLARQIGCAFEHPQTNLLPTIYRTDGARQVGLELERLVCAAGISHHLTASARRAVVPEFVENG